LTPPDTPTSSPAANGGDLADLIDCQKNRQKGDSAGVSAEVSTVGSNEQTFGAEYKSARNEKRKSATIRASIAEELKRRKV
jgi:hypothetical protein